MDELNVLKRQHAFILEMWRFVKNHRAFSAETWKEADNVLLQFEDVEFSADMMRAYIDTLPNERSK